MISRKVTYAGGLALAALALGWAVERAEAANLDKGLLKDAGPILDALAEKGVKTVGVLPFEVKKGARQAGFNAAPLATGLPGRLENAMIIGQGAEIKAIGVIRDAVGAANKAKVGSWKTSKAAFNKLFTGDYDLAWGNSKRKPDGFLTGTVVSTPEDRYHTKVVVELITPKSWVGGKVVPVKVHEIKIDTDRSLLRDLGYAYALPRSLARKKGVTSRDMDTQAVQQVDKEEKGQKQQKVDTNTTEQRQTSHTPDNVAGFRVEVEYDKVKQEIMAKDGGSQAKQPDYKLNAAKSGQDVWVYLTRVASDDVKLGAVIKVNGRSVFEEQDTESIGCKKWIYSLSDKDKRWDFGGYYSKGTAEKLSMKKFVVLTKEESDAKVSELGSRAGWIDIDIFASGSNTGGQPPEEELLISTRGAVKARGKTLKDTQDKIARANNLKLVKSKFTPRGGLIFMDSESRESDPYKSDELPNPKRVGGISIQYYENTGGKTID
ncbi:MAG: hypothetical protein ACRC33_17790 [Gemmataceae bacterium]